MANQALHIDRKGRGLIACCPFYVSGGCCIVCYTLAAGERRVWALNYQTGVIVMQKQLTAIIEREGDGYVSLCPEVDIASQGDTIEEARENLREALELFFEAASPEEIQQRLHEEVYVTRLEVAVG
jgi:predicted RNase H-like HicB family nuclease